MEDLGEVFVVGFLKIFHCELLVGACLLDFGEDQLASPQVVDVVL